MGIDHYGICVRISSVLLDKESSVENGLSLGHGGGLWSSLFRRALQDWEIHIVAEMFHGAIQLENEDSLLSSRALYELFFVASFYRCFTMCGYCSFPS